MKYFNYDDWKLSNPEDDGFYTEDTTDYINETTYFRYMNGKRWSFGMITKSGYDVRVHNYYNIPTIDIDEIEPTQTELNDEIYRVRMNYTQFAFIDRSEFLKHFNDARNFMDKLIPNEKDN